MKKIFYLAAMALSASASSNANAQESEKVAGLQDHEKASMVTPVVLGAFYYVGNQINGPTPPGWTFSNPAPGTFRFTAPNDGTGSGWAWPIVSPTWQGTNALNIASTAVIQSRNPLIVQVTMGQDTGPVGLGPYGFNLVIVGY